MLEQSRAPKSVPLRTDDYIERLIVSDRRKHCTWGGKKIHQFLQTRHAIESPPAISTISRTPNAVDNGNLDCGAFADGTSDQYIPISECIFCEL